MTGILNLNFSKGMINTYLQSFKFHITESLLSLSTGIFAFITLTDVPLIITILGTAIGTFGIPIYFGWRRAKKKEEREIEAAIVQAIKDLRELGFIDNQDTLEIQRSKAIEWLSKPVKKNI